MSDEINDDIVSNESNESNENDGENNLQILNPNILFANINNSLHYFDNLNNRNTLAGNNVFNQIFDNLIREINENYQEEQELEEALQISFDSYKQLERNGSINMKLKPVKYQTMLKDIKKEQKTCLICTDKFYYNQQVIFSECCQKCFHYKCLNEWVKYKSDCPTCRKKIETN